MLHQAGLVAKRGAGTFRYYRAVPEAVRGLDLSVLETNHKWRPLPGGADANKAAARTGLVVIVSVDADCDQRTAFAGFTDAGLYSRWMRAAVSIVDGHFSLIAGRGTRVRGTYDQVVAPSFIGMTWDHEAEATLPVPGRAQRAYLTITPRGRGCRVEVHQMVESSAQAAYMEQTWKTVLGRFKTGILAALKGGPIRRVGTRGR